MNTNSWRSLLIFGFGQTSQASPLMVMIFFDGSPKDMVVSVAPPIRIRTANVNIRRIRKEDWHGNFVDHSPPVALKASERFDGLVLMVDNERWLAIPRPSLRIARSVFPVCRRAWWRTCICWFCGTVHSNYPIQYIWKSCWDYTSSNTWWSVLVLMPYPELEVALVSK